MKKSNQTDTLDNVIAIPSTCETKSSMIRYLAASGLSRGDIVRYFKDKLGVEIRYQHVRNVLITPLVGAKK